MRKRLVGRHHPTAGIRPYIRIFQLMATHNGPAHRELINQRFNRRLIGNAGMGETHFSIAGNRAWSPKANKRKFTVATSKKSMTTMAPTSYKRIVRQVWESG